MGVQIVYYHNQPFTIFVGGWTNPLEKNINSQVGWFPQSSGWTFQNILEITT